jgi:ubiquinone/menaquinone biosynthesis C-methylase UbiE
MMNTNTTADDISTQYDNMGHRYLDIGQKFWFSAKPDVWTRSHIDKFIGTIEGKVIVDAGCGNGLDTKSYIAKGAQRVLAFDPSQFMLDNAKENVAPIQDVDIEFRQGSYEAIPFPDQCADAVIGIYSLHYCRDLDAAYAEISRVLKSGGRIAFSCTHPAEMTANKASQYKGQEVVSFKIYNKTVDVKKTTHTLSEYFSPFFLKHFALEFMEEWHPEDSTTGLELKSPKLIAFGAIKK